MFCIYILCIGKIVRKHGFSFHIYADDTQIYVGVKPDAAASVLVRLEKCLEEIRAWMCVHKLKLNDDKTEFMMISTKSKLKKMGELSLHMGATAVPAAESARNLGVIIDKVMDMDAQVTAICKSAYFQLHNIGAIRRYLTPEVTAQLIHAFVTSRLDYCNALLYGITDECLRKLKRVQNTAARIITLSRKYDHITPILKMLHWLPIHLRIEFKILLLTYKALHGLAPVYLSELLVIQVQERSLRSANKECRLVVQTVQTNPKTGDKAFSVTAPKLWNQLPLDIRNAKSVDCFKRKLKTYYFTMF